MAIARGISTQADRYMPEDAVVGVKNVQPGIARAYQQPAIGCRIEEPDVVAYETLGLARYMTVVPETVGRGVVKVESVRKCPNPQPTLRIFIKGADEVRRYASGIIGVMPEDLKAVTVIAV